MIDGGEYQRLGVRFALAVVVAFAHAYLPFSTSDGGSLSKISSVSL